MPLLQNLHKMESNKVVIGIDTSNYTTSVAIISLDGKLIANIKRLLNVKEGERGLRQSDALFSHTVNLPELIAEAEQYLLDREIVAVGVSATPRNVSGSYMPCFLAGISAAVAISTTHHVPLYRFSHQCGHIMAAIYSAGREIPKEFAAFHISGGTTELVLAKWTGRDFVCQTLGGTGDVNAGQIIDRIGVYMGMPFPAGKYIEEAAFNNQRSIPKKKPSVKGTYANLSGLENIAVKLYDETKDSSLTAAFVLEYIGTAVISVCENARQEIGDIPFVFAGGVMSNSIIKARLAQKFNAYFAEPLLSADNAVGIAVLAKNAYKYEKETEV